MSRNRSNALIEVDLDELRRVLADTTMPDDTKGKFKALLDTVDQILAELETKRVSVARLRRMLFGSKSEKSKKLGLDGGKVALERNLEIVSRRSVHHVVHTGANAQTQGTRSQWSQGLSGCQATRRRTFRAEARTDLSRMLSWQAL